MHLSPSLCLCLFLLLPLSLSPSVCVSLSPSLSVSLCVCHLADSANGPHFFSLRIGTLATTDIKFEDVYLGVPLSVILDSDKAYTDAKLGPMLQAITKKYNGGRDDM